MTLWQQAELYEEWLPVVGYEGFYEVSNWGRVRSLPRVIPHKHPGHTSTVPGRIRQLILKGGHYLGLTLTDREGKKVNALVHQLVAQAFIGPRPPGRQVDHRDGNKLNNFASNLRYVTAKQNANAGNHERPVRFAENHPYAKLSNADVVEIRRLVLEGMKQKDIAKMFKVRQQHISRIARHIGRRNG
jgi:hypothetical protein